MEKIQEVSIEQAREYQHSLGRTLPLPCYEVTVKDVQGKSKECWQDYLAIGEALNAAGLTAKGDGIVPSHPEITWHREDGSVFQTGGMPGKHFTYFVHPRKGHGQCAEEEGFIRQTLDEKLQELCRGQ